LRPSPGGRSSRRKRRRSSSQNRLLPPLATPLSPITPPTPGARNVGMWMLLLRCATQIRDTAKDSRFNALIDRAIEAVMDRHFNPDLRLNNEILPHDLGRPTGEFAQLVYPGHTFEITWMLLEEAVARGELTARARAAALARIVCANTVEAGIRDADLIIEAVPEELEMKLELFTIFDKFAKPGAIFVSTTRTMSVLDLSDVTVYRERCVGMRFRDGGISGGAIGGSVIELVRTKLTSNETVRVCREVAGRLAPQVLEIEDSGAAS